jgi:hypothetical protein
MAIGKAHGERCVPGQHGTQWNLERHRLGQSLRCRYQAVSLLASDRYPLSG